MQQGDKTILFLQHNAGRTGAPMVLLHLLRWLKQNTDYQLKLLLKEGGALQDKFAAVAEVTFLASMDRRVRRNPFQRVLRKIGLAYQQDYRHNPLPRIYPADSIDLVYVNSIAAGDLLKWVEHLECPIITHVHELGSWMHKLKESWEAIVRQSSGFIAVSRAVERNLIENCGIASEKVLLAYEFSELPDISNLAATRVGMRRKLGIDESKVVIGGSGAETWRKGKDLFVQLAFLAAKRGLNQLSFLWIGAGGPNWHEEHQQLQYDIETAGIGDRIQILPHVDNPYDYYSTFDIFAMTSREDPYPLVNIEVASLGIPIVCFEKSGGSSELVANDAGFVVPYLDQAEMLEHLKLLAEDIPLRQKMGAVAAKRARMHDVVQGASVIANIMQQRLESQDL